MEAPLPKKRLVKKVVSKETSEPEQSAPVQYRPKSPDFPPPPRSITPDVSAEKQCRVDAFIQKYKRVEQPSEDEPRRDEHRREPRRESHEPRREDSRDNRHRHEPRREDDFRRKSDARKSVADCNLLRGRANQNVSLAFKQAILSPQGGEVNQSEAYNRERHEPRREEHREPRREEYRSSRDHQEHRHESHRDDNRGQSRADSIPDHMRGGRGIDYRNKYNGRSDYHEVNRFKPTVSKKQLDRELEQFGAKRNEKK
jgi:hypothetical protein